MYKYRFGHKNALLCLIFELTVCMKLIESFYALSILKIFLQIGICIKIPPIVLLVHEKVDRIFLHVFTKSLANS